MDQPDLKQIQAAVAREPRNPQLRYLLGAELAQQKEYSAAVVEMSNALELDPSLHFARFQLGLLYLTMAQPNQSIATWAPLEALDDGAALKFFKRGLEALIRDDFAGCLEFLRHGIELNTQNLPLNRDMAMIIDRVNQTQPAVIEPVPTAVPTAVPATAKHSDSVRTDFSLYGDPTQTKH